MLRQPVSDHAKETILGAALKGQVSPKWTYTLDLDWIRRTDDNNTPGIYDKIPPGPQSVPPSVSNTDFKRTRFNAGSRFALSRDLALAIGANVTHEDGSTMGTLAVVLPQSFNLNRTTFLGTAGLEYSNSHVTATAGLSFNKSEGFGEVTSPRLGLNWLTTGKRTALQDQAGRRASEMPSSSMPMEIQLSGTRACARSGQVHLKPGLSRRSTRPTSRFQERTSGTISQIWWDSIPGYSELENLRTRRSPRAASSAPIGR